MVAIRGLLVVAALALPTAAGAQTAPVPLPENLGGLSAEDIAQGAIALVNFTSAPGISGANFNISETGFRDADLVRGNLGFETAVTFRDVIFDGFVAGWLGSATLDERIQFPGPTGEQIRIDADRSILSARVSGGLSFPVTRNLRIVPYVSGLLARFETESEIFGNIDFAGLPGALQTTTRDSEFNAVGVSGTIEGIYDRWFGTRRVDIVAKYTGAWVNTYGATDEVLKTNGTSGTLAMRARYSDTIGFVTANRPWRWNVFAAHTNFTDQPKRALGFTYYSTVGAGLTYEWNLKPLNWFGMRFVGLQAGVIFGDDVEGWTLGIDFQ